MNIESRKDFDSNKRATNTIIGLDNETLSKQI